MPTMSKLIAAVAFAVVAYIAAELFKPVMPEGTQFGAFNFISAGVGFLCGWIVMGGLTGKGYRAAAGSGMRTSVTTAVWVLLICSIILMVRKAFKMRYHGPMEAIVDIFSLALEYGLLMMTPGVIGSLLIGGSIGGMLAEWARRRWD